MDISTRGYVITHKYDVGALCNGILAGLVSITAGCGNMESGSAVATGLIGGGGGPIGWGKPMKSSFHTFHVIIPYYWPLQNTLANVPYMWIGPPQLKGYIAHGPTWRFCVSGSIHAAAKALHR